MTVLDELRNQWENRLINDYPTMSVDKRQNIIDWLLGNSPDRFAGLDSRELAIAVKGLEFRYLILQQRYLDVASGIAYKKLMTRLSSLPLVNNKIQIWIDNSRDRAATVIDIIQEVIMEMLKSDRYLLDQLQWLSQSVPNNNLLNNLLLATLEEYCLRIIQNKPLIAHRFINYLKRETRGGITSIPATELIRIVSEEVSNGDNSTIHLSDRPSVEMYQNEQQRQEITTLRLVVQQELSNYLAKKLDNQAVEWLNLYLQGLSPETIAKRLNLSPQKTSQLREKVIYHAWRGFAIKTQPELVQQWLAISLTEHNLGLTPQQWQIFSEQKLNEEQRLLITQLKTGLTQEEVGQVLKLSNTKILKIWTEICLIAQTLRN
jgi:hypothetical protein